MLTTNTTFTCDDFDVPMFIRKDMDHNQQEVNDMIMEYNGEAIHVQHIAQYDDDKPVFIRSFNTVHEGETNMTLDIHSGSMIETIINKQRRWWHGIGRYIVLIVLLISCLYVDKKIQDNAYYDVYYRWYTDQITDAEYHAALQDIRYH